MKMAGQITQFRSILPPSGRPAVPPPSQASIGGVILNALYPLRDELDRALAHDDHGAALNITYDALSRVADTLAAMRGDRVGRNEVLVHALKLDLTPLPLVSQLDGTLCEGGTLVRISYYNRAVDRREAAALAQALAQRFQSLWPGAWVFVSG